jgi:phosphonate transport system permease protein
MSVLAVRPPPLRDRAELCWKCFALALALVAAVIGSFAYLAVDYRQLFSDESIRLMAKFVREFFPPDLTPAFLAKAAWGALQTFAVAAIGTLLAIVFGALLALPAAGRFGLAPRLAARLVLNFLRSVPELVWAALMVIAAGLGPFAGTLALAAHTTGVLGRLFAESIENAEPGPADALRVQGLRGSAVFLYATLPQVLPQLMSYTLYRWENNIRAAAVLGVVGAGGLGQLLAFHMSLFHMGKTATVLIAMLGLVALVDAGSYGWRRLMMR